MRFTLPTTLVAIAALAALPSAAANVPGAPPPFALPDVDGKTVTLESFRGASPVLVVFYRGYW